MRRLPLILIAAGLFGILIYLRLHPRTLDQISVSILGRSLASTAQPAAVQPPASEKPATKKAVRRARPSSAPQQAAAAAPEQSPAPAAQPEASKSPRIDAGVVSVRTDSAPVYSANTPSSPVVHVLRKGDEVESRIQVVDSKGQWNLIRSDRGAKWAGFVRSENLEAPQIASSRDN